MSARSEVNFDSTINIRESIYQEWYEERSRSARAAKREQLKKEKEEEEKKKKVRIFCSISACGHFRWSTWRQDPPPPHPY